MAEKVYDYRTHSISSLGYSFGTFSLTISFLELVFEYHTNVLKDIFGFLPLVNAEKCNIELPTFIDGKFTLMIRDDANIQNGEVYNYRDKVLNHKNYFDNGRVLFDKRRGIICIGDFELLSTDFSIRVNENIVCTVDADNILKCLYIIPNKFVSNSV